MRITFGQRVAMGLRIGLLGWLLTPALSCWAAEYTWDGGGSDDNWSTGANWVDDGAPATDGGHRLIFDGTARVTPNAEAAYAIDSLLFTSAADPFTVTGGTLTLNPANPADGIQAVGTTVSRTQRVDNNLVLAADARFSTVNDPSNNAVILDVRGAIDLQSYTLTLQYGRYNHTHYLRGNISGTGNLDIPSAVVHFLGENNTFSGGMALSGAAYTYNNNSLGTGPITLLGTATTTIHAVGDDRTLSNDLEIGLTSGANQFIFAQKNFTLNGNVTLGGTVTAGRVIAAGVSYPASSPVITWNGDIGENDGAPRPLRLQGRNGSLHILNGSGSYTGATQIESGTGAVGAYFNGDFSLSSSFVVQTGTTLGGTGTISSVNVEAGGILAPGAQAAIGALEAAGDVALANDSLFRINIGVGANESDRLQITGGNSFTLGTGVTLELLGTLDGSSTYTLATYGDLSGTFATVLLNGSAQDFTDSGYSVTYGTDSMTLAIPEPGTLGLLLGAGLLLALRRRRAAAAYVPCGNAANN